MDELERVIYDLERCTCHVPDACRDCSKYASETGLKCMENLMMDALELLKEQEQKRAHWIEGEAALSYDGVYGDDYIVCSGCHKAFCIMDNCTEEFDYCPHCGAEMKVELE
jgi:hypothetical protein